MKFGLFSAFAVLFILGLSSAHGEEPESAYDVEQEGPILHRVRRYTCDVLSFEFGTIKVNHAACALHCVKLGFKGGYCNDQAVCVCRN